MGNGYPKEVKSFPGKNTKNMGYKMKGFSGFQKSSCGCVGRCKCASPAKQKKNKEKKTKIVTAESLRDRTGIIDKEGNRVIKDNDGKNLVVKESDRRRHELDDMLIGGDHTIVNDTLQSGPNDWGMTDKWMKHHESKGTKIYKPKKKK